MAIVEGAFVKTLFPTNENPRKPGPLHICYCIGVTPGIAIVAYSTSRPWPAGTPLPLGVRIFAKADAARLNQIPFVLYLNRLAKLPLTERWFPEIASPTQGVIAVAPPPLRDRLHDTLRDLLKRRRELIQQLGP